MTLKKPVVPHDILTTLCAIVNVIAQDPKKVKFVAKQLGKQYNVLSTVAFAEKHNGEKDV